MIEQIEKQFNKPEIPKAEILDSEREN